MLISAEHLDQLNARAQEDVDAGYVPSCQYALAIDGEVLVSETLGAAPADARFNIWSSTKPVFASVVWQLMGEGKLDPETRVVQLWPEFGAHDKDTVTLEHLLTFSAGFPEATVDLASIGDREARVHQMEQWTLDWEPGTAYEYHGLSAHWVLSELVMRVTGEDYRDALRERVLDPLGLDRLELGVPMERQADVQMVVDTGEPPTLEEVASALGMAKLPEHLADKIMEAVGGTAASPTADLHAFQRPEVQAAGLPGGGAVSDAASVALFYQALLHDPKGVWQPEILRDVTTNIRNTFAGKPLGVIANRTLGLEVQGDDPTARFRAGFGVVSPATFGHGGAAGQVTWADPVTGLSFAYLTNGADRNPVRQARRGRELSSAALACVS